MKECIREISAFYEAEGPYAVSRDQAQDVLEAAIEMTMRHTYVGAAIKSLNEAVYSVNEVPKETAVSLPDPQIGLHAAFFTRRSVEGSNGQVAEKNLGIAATALLSHEDGWEEIVGSSFLVRITGRKRRGDALALLTTSHELAHTFRMGHCQQPIPICLMKSSFNKLLLPSTQMSPFCYPCIADFRGLTNQYSSDPELNPRQRTGETPA